jgi:hypothetical protein
LIKIENKNVKIVLSGLLCFQVVVEFFYYFVLRISPSSTAQRQMMRNHLKSVIGTIFDKSNIYVSRLGPRWVFTADPEH